MTISAFFSQDCHIGDINGDGKDDIIAFVQTNGEVWVAYSNGSSFGPATKIDSFFCRSGMTCDVGDVDGDGKDDFVAYYHDSISYSSSHLNNVWVKRSRGTSVGGFEKWANDACSRPFTTCDLADINGDGLADLVESVFRSEFGKFSVYFAKSEGGSISTTASITFSGSLCNRDYVCTAGDFDGDGKDDLVRFVRDAYTPFSYSRRGDVYVTLSKFDSTVDPAFMVSP